MKTYKKLLSMVIVITCILACFVFTMPKAHAASTFPTQAPEIENIMVVPEADYLEIEIRDSKYTYDGYEIQFSTNSNFKINCQTLIIDSGNIDAFENTLLPSTQYYVRARGFAEVSESTTEYTDWSEIQTFSYDLTIATFKTIIVIDEAVYVQWNGFVFDPEYRGDREIDLPHEYGCVIEYSPSPSFDYDVETIYVHDASYDHIEVDNTLVPNQKYYFRIRSYKIIDGKAYYQKTPVCQTVTYKLDAPVIELYAVTDEAVAIVPKITEKEEYLEQRFLNIQISDSRNFDVILHDAISQDYRMAEVENKLQTGKQYYARIRYATYRSYEINYERINEFVYGHWSATVPISYNISNIELYVEPQGNEALFGFGTRNETHDDFIFYEIQYTQSNSFDDNDVVIVEGNEIENPDTSVRNLAPGSYIARVRLFAQKKIYDNQAQYFESGKDQYVKCYSDWSNTVKFVIAPETPRLDAIKLSDNQVTFNWNGVDGCSGYEIRFGTSENFANCKTIKIPNKTAISEKIINDLIPNTRYYFSIRSYCTGYGITEYSDWSNVMKATYRPTKTYIKHLTLGGDQSVIVDWKTLDYCDGYQIQYAYDNTFKNAKTFDVKDASEIETHINSLLPGVCYFRIRTIITINDVDYYSDWSNTKNIEFKFTKTYLTSQLVEDNVMKITWKAVNGDIYEIQYAKDEQFASAKTIRLDNIEETTDKLSHTINDDTLTPGTYYIRIRVVQNVDDQEYATDWSNAKTVNYKLTKTYIKTLSIVNGQMKVDWKTVDKIAGYQIQYGSDKNLTNGQMLNVLGSEVDNCAINDYAPGACYVRIRTYRTIGNQTYYSDWSNIKNISTQLTKTYITNQYMKNGKAVVAWKATNDCDGYEVQTATDDAFSQNTKLTDVAGGAVDKCEGLTLTKGINYLRVRTYKTINGVKHYSDWSNAKTLTVQ